MNKPLIQHPYYPIIFVRGFASSAEEIEKTTATPYMGFNEGSTMMRQKWTGDIEKHIFESPLIRFMKDLKYHDIYEDGMTLEGSISPRSVIIHRYYEASSKVFGEGEKFPLERYAQGLNDLIEKVKKQVCQGDAQALQDFKIYLVAHSMGGLICRAFLQNDAIGNPDTKILVDKVFTYATPHNGIDLQVVGNVPSFISYNNINNFSRPRMAEYLALDQNDRVDTLNGKFPTEKFFCLVGTNSSDYTVANGLSSFATGPFGDGLVMIKNATVRKSPRAFVHRTHSGPHGIINSESGYQNLVRFFFGDIKVDGVLNMKDLTLPTKVEKKRLEGKDIKASYHFEVTTQVRGARWHLHRRLTNEYSAIFRTYEDLFEKPENERRPPHLFSTYLSKSSWAKVGSKRNLGFSIEICVLVPEYEVDGFLFLDEHYEGGYIFRDKINIEVTAPDNKPWTIRYGFESKTPGKATKKLNLNQDGENITFSIPIQQKNRPGIDATLDIRAQPWNKRS